MALLTLGTPLDWQEAKKHADHVRKHGIIQFLNIWRRVSKRVKDHLLWGDEVEYCVVTLNNKASLCLDAFDALKLLPSNQDSDWKPEYARYMLEGTPGVPYGSTLRNLLDVEPNMKMRRQVANSKLPPDAKCLTLTNYPRLGCKDALPLYPPNISLDSFTRSIFIPDIATNPHARFGYFHLIKYSH